MEGGSPSPEVTRVPSPGSWTSLSLFCLPNEVVGKLSEVIVYLLGLLPPAADPEARIQVQVLYLGNDLRKYP